jgi:alanine racemase
MNLTTIDLSHTTAMRPGDEATLLGREGNATLGALEIAETAETTLCNTLCNISPRVRRIYRR